MRFQISCADFIDRSEISCGISLTSRGSMKKARSPSQRGITSGTLTQRGPRVVGRSAHFSESWLVYLLEWRTLDCAGPGRREYGIRKRLVQTCLSLILPLPFRRGCHGRGTHCQAFHPLTRKAAMLQFKLGFVAMFTVFSYQLSSYL